MLRRLLTCLALITGLAATGTPASAAAMQAVEGQVQSAFNTQSPGNGQLCEKRAAPDRIRARNARTPGCRPARTITVILPVVYLRADRSLE